MSHTKSLLMLVVTLLVATTTFGEETSIRPFRVNIAQADIADMRLRIAATRWPDKETVADSSQGVQLAKLQELVRYWGTKYDWRKAEATLNALPQFMTKIDGIDTHFIHVKSREKNALPLLILHGWPGSVIEQLKIIGPLTDPTAFGGRAEDAFDVVIPSLPGYGFSARPTERGWGLDRMARASDVLMKRLAYTRYVTQGGDWGSAIAETMGRQAPAGLLGIHVNLPAAVPMDVEAALGGGPVPAGLSEQERAVFDALSAFRKTGSSAYNVMMSARPQAVGYGMTDSPAGLAAFLLAHPGFRTWKFGSDPQQSPTRDDVLDNFTLYWLTNSATSAARLYWENGGRSAISATALKTGDITVPVAITVFPEDVYLPPETWARRAFKTLSYFHEVDKGGHFAAWEQPALFAEEVRAAFKPLRAAQAKTDGGSDAISPFRVNFPDEELADLKRRIAATRWPEREIVLDQSQGVQLATIQKLARYWSTDYDWRKAEAKLNRYPQFLTNIDGVDIHFLHVRSKENNALAIIVTHGWPGSVIEQLKIIDPLTNPVAHGGTASDAFDVVIPSLPGYGFSGKPVTLGWDPIRIARAWTVLMKRLGYTRYVAQGGDWGNAVTEQMALLAHPGLIGIHTNMPAAVPDDIAKALASGNPPFGLSADEKRAYDQLNFFYKRGLGYAQEMSNRPQTLYGIGDSPVGMAAWMLDHDASSLALMARVFDGQLEGLTRDDILDNATLYWLTNTTVSSARLYWESKLAFFAPKHITIPVAVSAFPDELYQAPKSWTERAYPQLIYYNRADKGGHFAAWEQPEIFVSDLRAAFKSLR